MNLFIDDPTGPDDETIGQLYDRLRVGESVTLTLRLPVDRESLRERLGLTEEDLAELAADAWYEAGRDD